MRREKEDERGDLAPMSPRTTQYQFGQPGIDDTWPETQTN